MTQAETKQVRDPIAKWLSSEGWRVWRNAIGPYSELGICDLMALKDGKFIAIETKLPGKKATAVQERFLNEMQKHNAALAIVADSLSMFKEAMRKAGVAE